MRHLVSAMLIAAGIVHLLPLSGVLGVERLADLYGLSIDEPNLAILMRHRAVLFGLIGGFLVYSAFKPALQAIALAGGIVSVVSFLWLAGATENMNAHIGRVFMIEVVVLVCLVVGTIAHVYIARRGYQRA